MESFDQPLNRSTNKRVALKERKINTEKLLAQRTVFVRQYQDRINQDAFIYGSNHFLLPFKHTLPNVNGQIDWVKQMHNAIAQLHKVNTDIEEFKNEAKILPYVGLINLRKFSFNKGSKKNYALLPDTDVSRYALEWTVYIRSEKNPGKTGYRRKVVWEDIEKILAQEQRTHDELLIHQRANAIMIQLNTEAQIAENTIKNCAEAITLLGEMGGQFNKAPSWVGIGSSNKG